jgi:hypothetical protein
VIDRTMPMARAEGGLRPHGFAGVKGKLVMVNQLREGEEKTRRTGKKAVAGNDNAGTSPAV